MTMLVHTSAYVILHNRLADCISDWFALNKAKLSDSTSGLQQKMVGILKAERDAAVSCGLPDYGDNLTEVMLELPEVLDRLEIVIENGSSDDRIDYYNEPKTYIVVGGSILARGLTLEGLTVSYFLRSANQYDTLLQMGRWFGYRFGYEDLPRVYMPESLEADFRALAGIETEIRQDIAHYLSSGQSPMEYAVRIRSLPGMAITSAAKMKHSHSCDITYWGQHKQTIRYAHKDLPVLERNWQAASDLLSMAAKSGESRSGDKGKLFKGVPHTAIARFLRSYSVHQSHRDLSSDFLLSFVEENANAIPLWNVGLIEPKKGTLSSNPLGDIGNVRLNIRSSLVNPEEYADIKSLMSRTDVLFDSSISINDLPDKSWETLKKHRHEELGDVPLLLIYAIDRNSTPKSKQAEANRVRKSLNAVHDMIGIAVVFPESDIVSGKYVSVKLDPPSADELEEQAAEEAASAEAAGVE